MAGKVFIRDGNIFEGGMDLTALPCSSKKTITSSALTWVKLFGLTAPEDMRERLKLGQITRPRLFTGDKSFTKHYTWAASVFNDRSTPEALEEIGKALGQWTVANAAIRNVETPLLGTGHGRLSDEDSAKGLSRGFLQTADNDANLFVFAYGSQRFDKLRSSLVEGKWGNFWKAVHIRPGIFGVSLDLKKLIGSE